MTQNTLNNSFSNYMIYLMRLFDKIKPNKKKTIGHRNKIKINKVNLIKINKQNNLRKKEQVMIKKARYKIGKFKSI